MVVEVFLQTRCGGCSEAPLKDNLIAEVNILS